MQDAFLKLTSYNLQTLVILLYNCYGYSTSLNDRPTLTFHEFLSPDFFS